MEDDELGSLAAQLKVIGLLFLGYHTLWYHTVAGGTSRAKILHVHGVDALGNSHVRSRRSRPPSPFTLPPLLPPSPPAHLAYHVSVALPTTLPCS